MSDNYHDDVKRENVTRVREKLKELPPFMESFFIGIADTKSPRTRSVYADDIKLFFMFLIENAELFKGLSLKTFSIESLEQVTAEDIERFLEYISYYTAVLKGGGIRSRSNDACGKSRKLAAVRTMFSYFCKKRRISSNPAELVDFPAVKEKAIIKLEVDEVARLLDEVESGENLTGRGKAFHAITKARDLAIITLLLGTGMRVSECVGINVEHMDFNVNAVKVTRKGGNEAVIYFGEEVADAVLGYMKEREKITPVAGNENALFLSIQRKRMGNQAIRILVKKYSKMVTTLKNITPHKLRSTFGTALYNETSDIYIVADVLGHADVNTTRKRYAAMSDERRRAAAKAVKLRED
ncbi:MAG: tyrosine-type recombinase/integrase [Clostridiales bacterium]|jgi:site-specific recombinase XerD|nr:tyrosine-type recombinase/integrase [Clostridiales bacterium]